MANEAHSARAHAKLAPSAAHRWMVCPASVVLEENYPNTTSSYAAEGSAAHELAGYCLAHDQAPEDFLGFWVDLHADDGLPLKDVDEAPEDAAENQWWEVTDDMVAAVTVYTDFVSGLSKLAKDSELDVEQRLDMSHLHPDIFGTGDATVYSETMQHLHVCDYKHGKGHVVDVGDNPQLLLYAVGAAMRYHNRPLKTMSLHVVQPRAGGQQIKSADYDIFDLFEFEGVISNRAEYIDHARDDFFKVEAGAAKMTDWVSAYTAAGEHCKFCRALAECPAARTNALTAAQSEFGAIGQEIVMKNPLALNEEELAYVLAEADTILTFVKAVQQHAHDRACAGVMPTGYKLVAKRANRNWRDPEEAIALLHKQGLTDDDLYEDPKLKSPAKIEKVMKKKVFEQWLEDIEMMGEESPIVKKSSGTNLVPVTDPRPAVKLDGASEFGSVGDES